MATPQQIFAFKSRFPEFNTGTDKTYDADIAMALDTAAVWIDQNVWSASDYPLAILFWAAHMLTLQQMQLASVQLGGTGETDIFIRQISFGERRVSFQQRQSQANIAALAGPGESLLGETIYGQMYLQLRTRNVAGVAVV